ncbi:MAG: hypothetical protein LBF58_01465 [Deltaproteobacteria bacterium]|jgi:hypothetical protein|nr:hypothetical protein [Deltaproteobacteria bacterium]
MKKINLTFQELAAEFNHNAQILYKLSQESFPDDMAEIVSMATSLTTDCQAMIELCLIAESRLSGRDRGDGSQDQQADREAGEQGKA